MTAWIPHTFLSHSRSDSSMSQPQPYSSVMVLQHAFGQDDARAAFEDIIRRLRAIEERLDKPTEAK